jgi:DNA-binding MarR family transcriptional regulator
MSTTATLEKIEATAMCLGVSTVHARLSMKLDEELGRFHGVGWLDFRLLQLLAKGGAEGLTTDALARALSLPRLALVRQLQGLEKTGFVQRDDEGTTRRVVLRPAGRRVFNEAARTAEEVCAPAVAALPAGSLPAMREALQELSRTALLNL